MVVLSAKGNLRICKKPVRTLSSSPTPIMQTIAGTPQTKSLTTLLMAAIVSKNMGESILSGAENTLFYQIAGRDARAREGGMCGKTAKMQGKMAKTVRSSTCLRKTLFSTKKRTLRRNGRFLQDARITRSSALLRQRQPPRRSRRPSGCCPCRSDPSSQRARARRRSQQTARQSAYDP